MPWSIQQMYKYMLLLTILWKRDLCDCLYIMLPCIYIDYIDWYLYIVDQCYDLQLISLSIYRVYFPLAEQLHTLLLL